MFTEQMTQGLSLADVINYQTVTNTSVNSLGIDMSRFKRALFVVQVDALGSAGTVDGRLQMSTSSAFSSVTNVTNSNLTQINTSSTVGNNSLSTIEVRGDQMAGALVGSRYLRLQLTCGGNPVTLSALGIGGEAEQKPASQFNLNTTSFISQQVVVNYPSA